MSDNRGPESGSSGFLATVRELASRISAQLLLFVLAIAVVVALVAGLFVPGLDALGRLILGLATLLVLLALGLVALFYYARQPTITDDGYSNEPPAASGPELVIDNDGTFVGGDQVVTGVVLDVVDMPLPDRNVRIRAIPLEDESRRLKRPDHFVKLRTDVRSYELSLGRLLRGSVHYYWKWEAYQLANAVVELRNIELPGILDREPWYVWSPDDPSRVVSAGLDEANVDSIRSGGYSRHREERDIPTNEPIWLAEILPAIVWTRVVPAVVAHQRIEYPGPTDPPVLDISGWVLSDRRPDELDQTQPSTELRANAPAWLW